MRTLIRLAMVAVLGAMVYQSLPDIRRYLKIRAM